MHAAVTENAAQHRYWTIYEAVYKEEPMAQVTLKGNPVQTIGNLPAVGEAAPGFTLVDKDLKEISLQDYAGQKVVLNIFPSIDTPTCAMSVRRFNAEIGKHGNAVAVCASMDPARLPMAGSAAPKALRRWCRPPPFAILNSGITMASASRTGH